MVCGGIAATPVKDPRMLDWLRAAAPAPPVCSSAPALHPRAAACWRSGAGDPLEYADDLRQAHPDLQWGRCLFVHDGNWTRGVHRRTISLWPCGKGSPHVRTHGSGRRHWCVMKRPGGHLSSSQLLRGVERARGFAD